MKKVFTTACAALLILGSSAFAAESTTSLAQLKKEKKQLQAKINFSSHARQVNKDKEVKQLKANIKAAEAAYQAKKVEKLKKNPEIAQYIIKLEKVKNQIKTLEK